MSFLLGDSAAVDLFCDDSRECFVIFVVNIGMKNFLKELPFSHYRKTNPSSIFPNMLGLA